LTRSSPYRRFLSDLTTDVGVALLSNQYDRSRRSATPSPVSETLPELPEEQTSTEQTPDDARGEESTTDHSSIEGAIPVFTPPRTFAFFRSYRFSSRFLDGNGDLLHENANREPQPIPVLTEQLREDSNTDSPTSTPSPLDPASPMNESQPASIPNEPQPASIPVSPIIFVGLRNVPSDQAFNPFNFFSSFFSPFSPASQGDSVLRDGPAMMPDGSGVPSQAQAQGSQETSEDVVMAGISTEAQAMASDLTQPTSTPQPSLNGVPSSNASPQNAQISSQTPNPPTPPAISPPAAAPQQFLLFLSAGFYPLNSTSPLQHYPRLFQNLETATYEDFLRLAEMLGNGKGSTVSKEQLEQSGLSVVKGPNELKLAEADGRVLPNTTERCLVCLEEYQAEDPIRLLSCKHAFHQ
jgi:hypothetical protein